MASSSAVRKASGDPTDVVISNDGTDWKGNDYTVDYDDVSVSFFNSATIPCLIIFKNQCTFGTSFLGLAPQGTISLNVLRREQTKYVVDSLYKPQIDQGTQTDIDIIFGSSQQQTIDMN